MGQGRSLNLQEMNKYENAVFVSYGWGGESELIVDELEQALAKHGISVTRDKKEIEYKGSIKDFEQRIGRGQCVILVISDKYLQSEHCMYELLEVDKSQNLRDRIFPIILNDARIYDPIDRLKYITYWEKRHKQLNSAIRENIDELSDLSGIFSELDRYRRIRASIDHLTDLLHDMNTLTPEMHKLYGFSMMIKLIKQRMVAEQVLEIKENTDSAVPNTGKSKQLEVTIKGNIPEIDFEIICYILSKSLHVNQQDIKIIKAESGSVKIRFELPEKAADELYDLLMRKDPKLYAHLNVIDFHFIEDELSAHNNQSKSSASIVGRESEQKVLRSSIELEYQAGFSNDIIGRETELALFREILKYPYGDKRILLLLGDGGIGKTKLVHQMLSIKPQLDILISPELIDLFSTDYRHIDGIQWKVKNIIEGLTGLRDESSPFAGWVKGKTDTSEMFCECLRAFCAENPLVLAFDTFENLDEVASDWLFKGGPNGLQVPGLICIVAGRKTEIEKLNVYLNNTLVESTFINGLTIDESREFFRKIENEFVDLLEASFGNAGLEGVSSPKKDIEWIWQLTNGHPLRLEMVFRWLGTLLEDTSLKDLTSDKFDELLMMQVRELAERGKLDAGARKKVSQPIYDMLLCMAHITRRFDEDFLQYFVNKKLIRLDDLSVTKKDIIDSLERYFFVKVRQGNSGHHFLQLHDEMARLIREYVWPYQDASGEKKQTLLDAVVKYYDQLIADSNGEETDLLRVEKLYYTFLRDWKEGLRQWFELAELGNENINKFLPGEIKKYLSDNYYNDEALVQIHSKIAEMEQNAGHIKQAVGHWEKVKELGENNQREDWVVGALIGLFKMAEPKQALNQYLKPAQAICEKRFPERLALIYYETGFAHRQMQDFAKAVEWYEKGIRTFQELPEDDPLEGSLHNDTGYAYLNLGRWGEAAKYLKEGLDIREDRLHKTEKQLREASTENKAQFLAVRNQSAFFVGLSRNSLGEYHRYVTEMDEALIDYDEAYERFVGANDYYWQAKCLCARGETYRRLAWQAWEKEREDSVIQGYVEKARKDIEESLYLCEKYQLDDERDTAYRRLGRLSHDLGLMAHGRGEVKQALEKLDEAYQYFKQGLEYAKKTKETLEELENLTELAFLVDDSVVFYEREAVPEHYRRAVDELEEGLKKHKKDPQRIYQYPVFEALLKMEQAAIALAEGDYSTALKGYVDAFKGLGVFPGYGHARYKQHFGHLIRQIEGLPKDEQVRWCKKFIEEWKKTKMPGREGKTLADDLLPDLVKWCNHLLKATSNL
jgi:tetratricopeptide (TPR) repeat protein